MKEYIKLFKDLQSADGYIINDIPFITTVKRDAESLAPQNARCNEQNKKLSVNGSTVEVVENISDVSYITYKANNEINLSGSFYDVDGNILTFEHSFSNHTGTLKFNGLVTCIGVETFRECSAYEFTIPNCVITIDDRAFFNCTSLNEVKFDDYTSENSLTIIGQGAFASCDDLLDMRLPESVTSIGKYAFGNDFLLDLIVPSSATFNDNSFEKVLNVTYHGSYSNTGKAHCWNGYVDRNTNFVYHNIEHTIFAGVPLHNDFRYIDIPYGVETIGYSAFAETDVKEVIIPNTVTLIQDGAFYECYNLTTITIPNSVKAIGTEAFTNCKNLSNVNFGNSMENIGNWAFNRTALSEVILPNSLNYIGDYAFSNCPTLNAYVPSDVSVGESAFNIALNVEYYGSSSSCPWGAKCHNGYVDGNFVYSDSTKTLLWACNTKTTSSIIIPNTVTCIANDVFDGYTNKIIFNHLDSGMTNIILDSGHVYKLVFDVDVLPENYNPMVMLVKGGSKSSVTYNIYTTNETIIEYAEEFADEYTIVNVYQYIN